MTTFTYVADFPVTETTTLTTRSVTYGTAEERLAYGLHVLVDTWAVKFAARTAADRDGILAFLEARGGTEPFTWLTPFGDTAQFLCPTWDSSIDSCLLSTVGASFILVNTATGPNLTAPAPPSTAFTYLPDFGTSQKYDTRVKRIPFGDGYSQQITYGIHPEQVDWQLTFSQRTNSERDAIRTYLRGAKGELAFSWTPPYGTAGKYVCTEWKTDYVNFNNNTINATFKQVFEP